MSKPIDSIKHNKDTRVHIPSKEETGYEEANEKVASGRKMLDFIWIDTVTGGDFKLYTVQTSVKIIPKAMPNG